MGCSSSAGEIGTFMYTSNNRIDHLYDEVKETITVLRREGGHLEVAYDTFLTVMGRPQDSRNVSFALLSLVVVLTADQRWHVPLPFLDSYPGLWVQSGRIESLDVRRAWEMWCKLAREVDFSLEYLEVNLPQASHCARVPQMIDKTISELSASPDIRAIDLRKLQRVAEVNRNVILEAAESLHRSVRKVKDVATQSMAVLNQLRERTDLQNRLLILSDRARARALLDPAVLSAHYQDEITALLAEIPLC